MPEPNGTSRKPALHEVPQPPHDLDAEAACISAAFLSPGALQTVRSILSPGDCYSEANRWVLEAIFDLHDSDKPIDLVTVMGWLRDRERLAQVGGSPYLAQLYDATPSVAHVDEHAKRVRTTADRRLQIQQAILLTAALRTGDYADADRMRSELAQSRTALSTQVGLLDAEAIWAPLPEPVYLASQLLQSANLTELVAFGSSGKSWMGVELSVSIAAGLDAFGRFPTKVGKVLYLDWEAGAYEMRRRFQAVGRGREVEGPVQGVFLASMPTLYMSAPDFESRLSRLAEGFDLLVFDTLKAASPGVDENSSDIRYGLDGIKRVLEKHSAAGLVLMHSKKTSANPGGVDPREMGRGSSAIFDAGDSVLHVLYREGEPLLVQQTKGRGGKFVEPFTVSITDTESGGVRVVAADPEKPADKDFDSICERVLELVRENPGMSGRVIRARAKGIHNTMVSAALEHLELHGAISNKGGAGARKPAKWFPAKGRDAVDPYEGEFDDQ